MGLFFSLLTKLTISLLKSLPVFSYSSASLSLTLGSFRRFSMVWTPPTWSQAGIACVSREDPNV